jgi:hypothetical protein
MVFGFIEKLKKRMFIKKVRDLNVEVETEQDKKIIGIFYDHAKDDKTRKRMLASLENSALTLQLQQMGELCGRKDCGRIIQKEPLVIQCHYCQKNFSDKVGISFAGHSTINFGS